MIIGITGTLASGKGTLVEYLKSLGFKHYSVRSFLVEEIKKRGLPVDRNSMVLVANDLRKNNSSDYLVKKIYESVKQKEGDIVIESLRVIKEVETLRKKENFYLFGIDANLEKRYERAIKRKSSTDSVDFKKFVEDEKREMINEDSSKGNIKKCIEMSDFKFYNNGTIEELYKEIEKVLEKIKFSQ